MRGGGVGRAVLQALMLSAREQGKTEAQLNSQTSAVPFYARAGFSPRLGQEAPRIESQPVFGFDGLQIRIVFDYGCAVLDYRGAVACAGA